MRDNVTNKPSRLGCLLLLSALAMSGCASSKPASGNSVADLVSPRWIYLDPGTNTVAVAEPYVAVPVRDLQDLVGE